ncbi:MAG: hypothetical protein AB7F59_13980 [Bdellovibrionales bacterium]
MNARNFVVLMVLFLFGCNSSQPSSAPNFPVSEAQTKNEGAIDSGGGELKKRASGSAWFVGADKTIRYCVRVAPDFGMPEEQVGDLISRSFQQWSDYMANQHKVYSFAIYLPRKHQEVRCGEEHDVTFLMGINTETVEKAKKHYDVSAAFAVRTEYDLDKGWGKGLVWVSAEEELASAVGKEWKWPANYKVSFWKEPRRVHGLILHEIGHIYGCGHMPGTIMREDIVRAALMEKSTVQSLPYDPELYYSRLTTIDDSRQLSFPYKPTQYLMGHLSIQSTLGVSVDQSAQHFELLVGRKPVGKMYVLYRQVGDSVFPTNELLIKDQLGVARIPLQIVNNNFDQSFGASLFHYDSNLSDMRYPAGANRDYSRIKMAKVLLPSGKEMMVGIDENTNNTNYWAGGFLRIRKLERDVEETLFHSSLAVQQLPDDEVKKLFNIRE